MDREDLLEIRKRVYDEYVERVKLGEFDVNAKSITICLQSLVEITNHLLEEAKKRK